MSSFADLIEVIRTHCETVAAAVTPAITVVRMADRQSDVAQLTVQYEGDEDSPFGGNTFGKTQVGEKLTIALDVPISSFDKGAAEAVEIYVQDVKARIKARLWGDLTLTDPTSCIGMVIGNATTGYVQQTFRDAPAGPIFRTMSFPIVLALPDVDTIAI